MYAFVAFTSPPCDHLRSETGIRNKATTLCISWMTMLDASTVDLEQLNRYNFRSALEALARPGEPFPLQPLFSSPLLAMASVLLYGETSFHCQGSTDFDLVRAISGAAGRAAAEADYIFADAPDEALLAAARAGTGESPELGATLIFLANATDTATRVRLSGPGIDGIKETCLPLTPAFIAARQRKNAWFPLGVDILLLQSTAGEAAVHNVLALPRTTAIEVLP